MSDAEAVRYDRQIRLWGKSTQQQLMHTNVELHGVSGMAAEAAKNLVLAGVRGVAVLDGAPVSKDDLLGNYLMQGEDGATRASRALQSLHRLNPYVRVCATCAELDGAGSALVRIVGIHSLEEGSACVRAEEARQSGSALSSPPADILVLHATLESSVQAFVLYRRLSPSLTMTEQWRRLVEEAPLLSAKPAAYQRVLLSLHLRNAATARRTFADAAAVAYGLMDRLHLQQLGPADVEAALRVTAAPADCVCATVAGACVAQHLIRQIGALHEPPDAQAHRWLLCSTAGEVECLVGM